MTGGPAHRLGPDSDLHVVVPVPQVSPVTGNSSVGDVQMETVADETTSRPANRPGSAGGLHVVVPVPQVSPVTESSSVGDVQRETVADDTTSRPANRPGSAGGLHDVVPVPQVSPVTGSSGSCVGDVQRETVAGEMTGRPASSQWSDSDFHDVVLAPQLSMGLGFSVLVNPAPRLGPVSRSMSSSIGDTQRKTVTDQTTGDLPCREIAKYVHNKQSFLVPYSSSDGEGDQSGDASYRPCKQPACDSSADTSVNLLFSCSSDEDSVVDYESYVPDSHDSSSECDPVEHQLCAQLNAGGSECPDEIVAEGHHEDNADQCKDETVRVAVTHNSRSRRRWDRKNVCKFCRKPQSKLSRHLLRKHADEFEVAEVAAMPLKSNRRKVFLQKLLNEGNYVHNIEVLSSHSGEIIPRKRPASTSMGPETFIPCEYCKSMFVKKCLWKHRKTCPLKLESLADSADGHVQGRGCLLLPISPDASDELKRDILSAMQQDEVTAALRRDNLIMKFGSRLHFKHSHLPHRWQYVRDRVRQMGRLLVEMRKTTTIKCLTDCLIPEQFGNVVKAVRSVCGFNPETHLYRTPSLALKIGHSLKECCRTEINSCAVLGSSADEMKGRFEQFLHLCDGEWSHEVSSHALRSLSQRRFNKPTILPLAEDVRTLHDYLTTKGDTCLKSLSLEPTVAAWSELGQITLAQVVAFNRRRGGEAQRLLVSAYSSDAVQNVSEDVSSCLSRVELALCDRFRIIHVEGKRGRKVPVLLTTTMQSQISSLLEMRSVMGVPEANKFVFARRGSLEPIRSSDCLRKFSRECGARNPASLTSTRLRKHVATMSQMLCLREHELDLLAAYMGHDIKVHREFYRLPEETLQVAKVSKLLLAMERGELASLQGRNFDDVNVDVPGVFLLVL